MSRSGDALVTALAARGLTIAVAESLTGGLLIAELVAVPGASAVVLGGVVAYSTALKASLLGVDSDLLAARGPVDAEVAMQMASGVRERLAVAGRPADIGVATTGVAGPGPQDGHPAGTVFLGFATDAGATSIGLALEGDRAEVRAAAVAAAIDELLRLAGVDD